MARDHGDTSGRRRKPHDITRPFTRAYETDPDFTRNSGQRLNCTLVVMAEGRPLEVACRAMGRMVRALDELGGAVDRGSWSVEERLAECRELAWVASRWIAGQVGDGE